MCGIAGVYHFNSSKTADEITLVHMRDSLVHRGPDSAGLYISPDKKVGLGFRRLAIIDLSEAGNQPMPNEDKSIWIVFNGEIYNFQELRKELIRKGHTFRSNTDTEVVIHQYEEDGPGCLEKLNGMFAFAIYDERKKQIFFARDRLGIKPFYYGVQNGTFLFGSEIKAILADSNFKRELNKEGLYHYVTFACCPAPYTLFKDIQKLPAGWCGVVHENGNIDRWQYWDAIPNIKTQEHKNIKTIDGRIWTNGEAQEEYYIEEVRRLLEDSVRGQMVSDVPFGVFLSGGIDSSTNAIFMSEALGHPVETFSIGFRDFEKFNELQYSRQIAEMLGAKRHEALIGEEELFEFLPKLAYHADDPNGDPVCLPVYYVSKLTRDSGVIMAQVGEGADELFSGYDHYLAVVKLWQNIWRYFDVIPTPIRKTIAYSLLPIACKVLPVNYDLHKEVLRRLAAGQKFFWGGAIAFTDYQKQSLLMPEFQKKAKEQGWSSYALIKQYYDKIDAEWPEADFLQKMAYLELKIRLPELLLMRVDKMSMAHSIETRVPFLDHRIVELAMQIPMEQKIKNMTSKHILKKAVAGKVPENIINRKKQGFGAPVSDWMRGGNEKKLSSVLLDSSLMKGGYFDREYVQKLIDDHQASRTDNSFRIWNLLTLALWHNRWL